MNIEEKILQNLIFNKEYVVKVLPFLKEQYFKDDCHKAVFKIIDQYINNYLNSPSLETIEIELDNSNLTQNVYKQCIDFCNTIKKPEQEEIQWLVDTTEKFCQDAALWNAIRFAASIVDGEEKSLERGSIQQIITDALSVSFSTDIGHDYLEDYKTRYEYYTLPQYKIPFCLDSFNRITNNGVSRKTLNLFLAPTNVGKTMLMCNFAAGNLIEGKNVLYITLEMSREEIGKRIDANLLDISMNELTENLDFERYERRIKKIKHITSNKLVIQEYPTSSANSNHFRHLLHELKLKKKFVPDIIYIDYLNICSSVRYKKMTNSYDYVKGIAEELRGLAVEYNVPIISATQANRAGTNNSDMDITNISESFGTGMTVDLLIGLLSIPELEEKNQLLVKVLKTRYGDKRKQGTFVISVDYDKMKIYDVDYDQRNISTNQIINNPIQPSKFDKKKIFANFK